MTWVRSIGLARVTPTRPAEAVATSLAELPGATRKFDSFWAAAEEAGQSRIYGGIHWQFDNTEGLAIGKNLAQYVGRSYLVAVDR